MDLTISLLTKQLSYKFCKPFSITYHYGKDAEGYFTDLSVLWSDLSDCDLVVGGGDLNSRTKNEVDYIPEIDGKFVLPRTNPDDNKNSHGGYFLQFLKDNRALICNGRVTPELNDFTFLNARGRSVPDYIYCPADHIHYCKSLKVIKMSDVINEYNLHVPTSVPDHSILVSQFNISTNSEFVTFPGRTVPYGQACHDPIRPTKPKKNIRKMTKDF